MPRQQTRAQSHGIEAKWRSECGLCGARVEPGDRIFKLPASRTGHGAGPWVCWTCRWPSSSRPTIESVRRKVRHRLALHQSIGLNKAEATLLAEALDCAAEPTEALLELRRWLTTCEQDGVPTNLTMDDARTALLALDSAEVE